MTRTAAEMLEPIPANALFGTAAEPGQLNGVVPLGSRAEARFRAPARGMLTAHCTLAYEAQQELVPFWELAADRAQLSTPVVVHDGQGPLVCDGSFTWSLRRRDG